MTPTRRSTEGEPEGSETPSGHRPEGGSPLAAGAAEILAIGREMLAIPAAMALGLAERIGLVVLAGWRFLRPLLISLLAAARSALRVLERVVTPARAVAAVAIAAAVLLAIAQFVDYREVRAGVPAYAEVESIAPPPQIEGSAETIGSAHAFLPLAASIATIAIVVLAMAGRWRLPRVLLFIGLAVIALTLALDLPKGLDEGSAAIEFQGAEARLLGAFWVQLACGVVIAASGPLLAAALRPRGARAQRSRSRRPREPRPRMAPGVPEASS
jgi:hypothetical protein